MYLCTSLACTGWQNKWEFQQGSRSRVVWSKPLAFLMFLQFFLVCFLRKKWINFLSVEVCSRFCFLKQEAMPFKNLILWLKSWLPRHVYGSIPCFRGLIDMQIQYENYSLIIVFLIMLFFDENSSFSLSGDKCRLEITALWAIPTGLKGRLDF